MHAGFFCEFLRPLLGESFAAAHLLDVFLRGVRAAQSLRQLLHVGDAGARDHPLLQAPSLLLDLLLEEVLEVLLLVEDEGLHRGSICLGSVVPEDQSLDGLRQCTPSHCGTE